jgi:hypothetical protein
MAADVFERQFTQIHNGLFRDARLSFKAKGIFGLISTHRDGYGVSEEGIAGCGTDGLASVRSGIKELIEHGYLRRTRTRDELGRLGESEYYITDMPDGLTIALADGWATPGDGEQPPDEDLESPSSEPTCENHIQEAEPQNPRSQPTCDSPTLADPTLENPRLENRMTIEDQDYKNTSEREPPSPADAEPDGAAPDTGGEGGRNEAADEVGAPDDATGHQVGSAEALQIARAALSGHPEVRNGRLAQIAVRIDDVLRQGAEPDALGRYLSADLDRVGSAPAVLLHRLDATQLPAALFPSPGVAAEAVAGAAPNRREWCGKQGCDPVTRQIEIDDPAANSGTRIKRCPICHPLSVVVPAF